MDFNAIQKSLDQLMIQPLDSITRHDIAQARILITKMKNKEYLTIDDWMRNFNIDSLVRHVTCQGVTEYRLTEMMQLIIRDIIQQLFDLHIRGQAHGSLSSETVLVRECNEFYEGRRYKAILFPCFVRNSSTAQDFSCLISLIRAIIPEGCIPKDVNHFLELLKNEVSTAGGKFQVGSKILLHHPCLWSAYEVYTFVENIHIELKSRSRAIPNEKRKTVSAIKALYPGVDMGHHSRSSSDVKEDLEYFDFHINAAINVRNERVFSKVYKDELLSPEKERAFQVFHFVRSVFEYGCENNNRWANIGSGSGAWIKEVDDKVFCLMPDFLSKFIEKVFYSFQIMFSGL